MMNPKKSRSYAAQVDGGAVDLWLRTADAVLTIGYDVDAANAAFFAAMRLCGSAANQ